MIKNSNYKIVKNNYSEQTIQNIIETGSPKRDCSRPEVEIVNVTGLHLNEGLTGLDLTMFTRTGETVQLANIDKLSLNRLKDDEIGALWRSKNGWMNGATVLGDDDKTLANASRMVPEQDLHQILIHGTQDGDNFCMNGNLLTPEELACIMLEKGFPKGTPVRLISCWTGVHPDGAAYTLSGYLKAPILAPNERVRVLPGGGYDILHGGRFKNFKNTNI